MAGTGLGLFLPSETAYKDPGRFRDVLEAEGGKEAQYLASMDQFFAQLEESQRQFDVTTEQRQEFFEEELAWAREKSEAELEFSYWAKEQDVGLGERGQDVQRFGYESQRDVGMAGIGQRERESQRGYDLGSRELDLAEQTNAFYRSLYRSQEERSQEAHDVAREGIFGMSGAGAEGGWEDELQSGWGSGWDEIYSSQDEGGMLSFSNVLTEEADEGLPEWYSSTDWEDTLW
jgi:hypothetical protein